MYAVFGPGSVYITRNDAAAPANQTSYNIGYVNEFSVDLAAETKELYGTNQFPLAVARGTIKATGKMKAALISGLALNACFYAGTLTNSQLNMSIQEPGTIPTTPYQITVAHSATFDTDLGVVFATTGLPLAKVPSAPATGQYSVAAGVYTFAAADTTKAVLITYAYTTATTAQRSTIANTPIGSTPTFQLDYSTSLNGNPYYLRIYACVSAKLTQQFKLTDFMMPEIDFGFFANAGGNVYQVSYADAG